ncbi:hypothetical protein [Micromonospora sp. NPDC005305]|uniref:hypothetical protein n=1 Tax=Micromonospora sp. NPDC005305 TaxID=3156875 RepID=UPI0033B8CD00
MTEFHLAVLRRLLQDQGYALDPDQLAEACAHHPDHVCALLSAAGAVAATGAQITALTDAANLLCDAHANGGTDTTLSARERLDQVTDALTAALAQQDRATAALRRACEALIHTGTALVSIPDGGSADANPAGDTTGRLTATSTTSPSDRRAAGRALAQATEEP